MTRDHGALATTAALTGLTAVLLFTSLRLQTTAAAVPIVVAVPTVLLLIHQLVREVRRRDEASGNADQSLPGRERSTLLWMAVMLALMWLAGIVVALPIYLLLHLRLRSRERWSVSLAVTGAAWLVLFFGLGWLLETPPPPGALWTWWMG